MRSELLLHCYQPKPLVSFIIRDPKTRKISKSEFRDRIIHHALCNIIEPIFEKRFICDSYANRICKGTLKAIERFDCFKRKISRNNTLPCYILKADIKKYFENVDHKILIVIISKTIKDKRILWLVKRILENSPYKKQGKGMPLGNLTSQFFANVYLNELDKFVKHKLRARYYIRYVDDFVILEKNRELLNKYKGDISKFILSNLFIELHPEKSQIIKLNERLSFLGFRMFYHHKLLKKQNVRLMNLKMKHLKMDYENRKIDYDAIYDAFEGWIAYARQANTYNLRKKFATNFEADYPFQISSKEVNRLLAINKVRLKKHPAT